MVVVDTNIVIDHLRQPSEKSKLLKLVQEYPDEAIAMSVVSIQELYEGKSTKSEEAQVKLLTTLNTFEILEYSFEVAKLAGTIARDIGRPIDFVDVTIAATAIINNAQLATLNKKDFVDIKDLDLL